VITAILGGALLVIGAILTFTGAKVALGIGLMIVGAAALGTVAYVNWDTISTILSGKLSVIATILSGALLVIGAILTFTGANLILGIGLMVAGTVGLATTVAVNWNTISNALQGPIGTITAILSGALLVIGAILLFTGAGIPLGLGLMAAGAVGLAVTIAANWNTITNTLGGTINTIGAIVSAAILVIGVILLFTGAGIPLGLGLIAAGAAGLAVTLSPNWNFILEKVKNAWQNLKSWWSQNASKWFTAEHWLNLGKDMIAGLFNGLGQIAEKVKEWANNLIAKIKDKLGIHSPSTVMAEIGKYLIQGLINGITGMFNSVVSTFTNLWTKIKNVFSNVTTWFRDTFSQAWQAVKNVFSSGGAVFTGIKDGILSALKSVINTLISGINTVISIPFQGINSALTKIRNISILGLTPFSGLGSISVPQIPKLAAGAVIPPNKEFMAVLGDQSNGNNLETPEKLLRQIVREEVGGGDNTALLEAILAAIKAGKVMKVDKRVLAKVAAEGINDLTISNGKTIILV
jgi:hypothetical protein